MNDAVDADEKPQTLVGVSFDDAFRAREFMTAVSRLSSRHELAVDDAVLIVKDDNGDTKVTETIDPQARDTAISGAIWTSLLGLILGGPVGWVAGAAIGAGSGVVAAKVIDLGISDDWVDWFRAAVQPGNAIVALLLSDLVPDALVAEAERFPRAQLMYANLDPTVLAELHEHWGEPLHHDAEPTDEPTDEPERS